jgi:hypothetical protein
VNKLRDLLRPKLILSGLAVVLTVALGYGFITAQPAQAASDCSTNSVIKCGFSGLADFKAKCLQNQGNVQKIYGHWGVDCNTFAAQAKHVTVYKNGEVKTDDGTIVATGANSAGRERITGNIYTLDINGLKIYYGPNSGNFNQNSLSGYAQFNDDHSMKMAALEACGNPVWGKSPGYKCQTLKQTKVNDTTYKYVATPFTKNGSTVTKIVYDFGDGKTQTVTSNFGQEVTHTYAPGKYTARATVYFNIHGKEKSDTRIDCTKPVDVPQPPKPTFVCTGLVAKQVQGSRTKFTFTASGAVTNGAVLQSGTFKFDDGKTATANAVGNTVTTTYEYTKVGNHKTTVDLTFNKGKDVGNKKCEVVTTTTAETCEDTPNKPECQTCETHPDKPGCEKTCDDTPNAPECQPKKDCDTNPEMAECKEIPSTGPVEVLGSVLGLSTVTGAGVYYRASRRNLLDKLKG